MQDEQNNERSEQLMCESTHPLMELVGVELGAKSKLGGAAHVPHGSPEAIARKHMLNVMAAPPQAPETRLHGAVVPFAKIMTEKPEHRYCVLLKTLGHTDKEIAEKSGYTPEYVRNILAQPWARQQQSRIMEESDERQLVDAMLKTHAPKAMKLLMTIIDDEKAPVQARAKAAESMLDRFLGKATQTVQVRPMVPETQDMSELDQRLRELEAKERDLYGRTKVRHMETPDLGVVEVTA